MAARCPLTEPRPACVRAPASLAQGPDPPGSATPNAAVAAQPPGFGGLGSASTRRIRHHRNTQEGSHGYDEIGRANAPDLYLRPAVDRHRSPTGTAIDRPLPNASLP